MASTRLVPFTSYNVSDGSTNPTQALTGAVSAVPSSFTYQPPTPPTQKSPPPPVTVQATLLSFASGSPVYVQESVATLAAAS